MNLWPTLLLNSMGHIKKALLWTKTVEKPEPRSYGWHNIAKPVRKNKNKMFKIHTIENTVLGD